MKRRKTLLHVQEAVMLLICAVFFIPIYYLIVSTFKTQNEIVKAPLALPAHFTLMNYAKAFQAISFFRSFGNSLFVTAISVTLIVVISAMAAYTLARKREARVVKFLDWYLFLGFLIPLQTTMIPLFSIMKGLKLTNSLLGLIFLHCNGCVFGSFLYKGFIKALPEDLEEAARIDGAGTTRIFWKIVFPLLKPITTTLVIFNVMWTWNDFLYTYLFISSSDKSTLIMQVYNGVGQYYNDWSVMMPVLVIALLPMVIFYLILQNQIIGGLTMGSMKN